MSEYKVRKDIEKHISELKEWLRTQEYVPLEEMGAFFTARISDYEEHMMLWKDGYRIFARLVPEDAKEILDLGCGTGLELDELFALGKDISVTGIDLCPEMLAVLHEKHPSVNIRCDDYFESELGENTYDCIISFESLHHFSSEKKLGLFVKIHRAIKPGGMYLEGDYLACCQEEEDLLFDFCCRKRAEQGIPEESFIHFDTPLTVEHELALLKQAGFSDVKWLMAVEGASIIRCVKENDV